MGEFIKKLENLISKKNSLFIRLILALFLVFFQFINSLRYFFYLVFLPPQKSFSLLAEQSHEGTWERSYYVHRKIRHNVRFGSFSFTLLLVSAVLAVNFVTSLLIPVNKIEIAYANTYTVSNLNDSGAGSFRQAITQAASNSGPDIISCSTTGTINLNSNITINDSSTLTINCSDITLNGGAIAVSDPVFDIESSFVTINNLTIDDSNGKGIYLDNVSNVTLRDVTISNSEGIGIDALGVSDSLFSNLTIDTNGSHGLSFDSCQDNDFTSLDVARNGGNGIKLNNVNNFNFTDSSIYNNDSRGILIEGNSTNNIFGNLVLSNNSYSGMELSSQNDTNNSINNGSITDNGQSGIGYGIEINNASSTTVTGNTIASNNDGGVYIGGNGSANEISLNIITAPAITVDSGSNNDLSIDFEKAIASNDYLYLQGEASVSSGEVEVFGSDISGYLENYITTIDLDSNELDELIFGDYTDYDYLMIVLIDDDGNTSSSYTEALTIDDEAPVSTANPDAGTYTTSQTITLVTADENDNDPSIYYTLDGSEPTTSSSQYSESLTISETTTLKFFAVDKFLNEEEVTTLNYVITSNDDSNDDNNNNDDSNDEDNELITEAPELSFSNLDNQKDIYFFTAYLAKLNQTIDFDIEADKTFKNEKAELFIDDVKQKNKKGKNHSVINKNGKAKFRLPVKDNKTLTNDGHVAKTRVVESDGDESPFSEIKSFTMGSAHSSDTINIEPKKANRKADAINTALISQPTIASIAPYKEGMTAQMWSRNKNQKDYVFEGEATIDNNNGTIANYSRKFFLPQPQGTIEIIFKALDKNNKVYFTTDPFSIIYYKPCPAVFQEAVVDESSSNNQPWLTFNLCSGWQWEIFIDGELNGKGIADKVDSGTTAAEAYKPFLPLEEGNHEVKIRTYQDWGKPYVDTNIDLEITAAAITNTDTTPAPTISQPIEIEEQESQESNQEKNEEAEPALSADRSPDEVVNIDEEVEIAIEEDQANLENDSDLDGLSDSKEDELEKDEANELDDFEKLREERKENLKDLIDEILEKYKKDNLSELPNTLPYLTEEEEKLTEEEKQELKKDLTEQTEDNKEIKLLLDGEAVTAELLENGVYKYEIEKEYNIEEFFGIGDSGDEPKREITFTGEVDLKTITTKPIMVLVTIFSEPIVKMAQVDSKGKWTITVPLELLPPGEHVALAQVETNGVKSDQVELTKFVIEEKTKLSKTTLLVLINLVVIALIIMAIIFWQLFRNKKLKENLGI